MTVKHAVSALRKKGWKVSTSDLHSYSATRPGNDHEITFFRNGQESENVVCLKVRRLSDENDILSDYHAGVFADTIPQALRFARDTRP